VGNLVPGRAGAKFTDMWNRLVDLGQAGEEILAAWIAKEELRTLLSLALAGQVFAVAEQSSAQSVFGVVFTDPAPS
jgi:hypothetical protein